MKVRRLFSFLLVVGLLVSCADSQDEEIGLDSDHPAYQFYLTARAAHVSEKSCEKVGGSSLIEPVEIEKEENYTKLETLASGLYRMKSKETGKTYITASYLQQVVFASMPKACSWPEESS